MTDTTDHPAHYAFGPSGAHRWLKCNASPELEAGYPNETSDAADEGTAAHWLLEQCLLCAGNAKSYAETNSLTVIPAGEETGTVKDWPVTGEMLEAVQTHIDFVLPDILKRGTRRFIEERVMLPASMGLDFPVGGTADTILYLPRSKTLKVVDFKYGRNIVVEADDGNGNANVQLGIYGLAALAEIERLMGRKCEVKKVELSIVQPRAFHKKGPVRTIKLEPFDLMGLELDVIEAVNGPRVKVAGEHCRFCRHKGNCEEYAAWRMADATSGFEAETPAQEVTVQDAPAPAQTEPTGTELYVAGLLGKPVKGLTRVELGRAKAAIKFVQDWAKEVEAEVKARLLHDLDIPGYRLAMGRNTRAFGGSEQELKAAVEEAAARSGREVGDFYKPSEMLSPSKLETLLGKKEFKATELYPLLTSTEGGPVVVGQDSDKPDYVRDDGFSAEAPQENNESPLL